MGGWGWEGQAAAGDDPAHVVPPPSLPSAINLHKDRDRDKLAAARRASQAFEGGCPLCFLSRLREVGLYHRYIQQLHLRLFLALAGLLPGD